MPSTMASGLQMEKQPPTGGSSAQQRMGRVLRLFRFNFQEQGDAQEMTMMAALTPCLLCLYVDQ